MSSHAPQASYLRISRFRSNVVMSTQCSITLGPDLEWTLWNGSTLQTGQIRPSDCVCGVATGNWKTPRSTTSFSKRSEPTTGKLLLLALTPLTVARAIIVLLLIQYGTLSPHSLKNPLEAKRPRRKRGRAHDSQPPPSQSHQKYQQWLPHNRVERKYRKGLNAELERFRRTVPTLPISKPRHRVS